MHSIGRNWSPELGALEIATRWRVEVSKQNQGPTVSSCGRKLQGRDETMWGEWASGTRVRSRRNALERLCEGPGD